MFDEAVRRSGEHGAMQRPLHRSVETAPTQPRSTLGVGAALRLTAPLALTAALAALAVVVELPGPAAGLPLALFAVVLVQLGGVLLARELELAVWRRVWLLALGTSAALLPMLALQAASSRVPFVSLARGSASLLIWSTLGAIAVVVGLAVLTAIVAADAPESASLLFVPAALLVPAVLGAPTELDQRSALLALAEASAVAAVACGIGWLLPPPARPAVAPVALGVQFVVLWLLGLGPVFAPGRGAIVPALAIGLLLVTTLATVLVPIAALVARRFAQTVREHPPRQPPPPPAPAAGRWREELADRQPATRPSARPRDH